MENDLESKLIGSHSFRSLQMESQVANLFPTKNWRTVNGCYFKDQKDYKVREVDCVSSYVNHVNKPELLLRIHIVVECKTMKGYHVIVGSPTKADFFSTTHSWFGQFKENKEFIASLLAKKGLLSGTINSIMAPLNNYFYPYEPERIADANIDPYTRGLCSSSFRETNSEVDKEFENSVIWKATQSLKSAIISFRYSANENTKDDIIECFTALRRKDFIQEIERCKFYTQLEEQTNCLDIYHPVIVTDAQIWTAKDSKIERIDHFRFSETGLMDTMKWWYDVVSREHISAYIPVICRYYADSVKQISKQKSRSIKATKGKFATR